MIEKLAHKIAGIDSKLLDNMPNTDKKWATHIGLSLMLSYMLVTLIVYFSLNYIDGAKAIYDSQNDVVTFDDSVTMSTTIIYIALSILVSSFIMLFDRSVFMSDWFLTMPYGVSPSLPSISKPARPKVLLAI